MKTVCSCYRTLSSISGRKYQDRCTGTKEIDICNCGGDRTRCDFYPEVRKKANECVKTETLVGLIDGAVDKLLHKSPNDTTTDIVIDLLKMKELIEKDVTK